MSSSLVVQFFLEVFRWADIWIIFVTCASFWESEFNGNKYVIMVAKINMKIQEKEWMISDTGSRSRVKTWKVKRVLNVKIENSVTYVQQET